MDEERCRWAIKFVTSVTRCKLPSGHLQSMHEARGLAEFPHQTVEWFPGDEREFQTERTDEHAWEDG